MNIEWENRASDMALDFVILADDEDPLMSLALAVNGHAKLMEEVTALELPLFQRVNDYYGDAEIDYDEFRVNWKGLLS